MAQLASLVISPARYYGQFETSFIAYRQVPPKVAPIKIGNVDVRVAKLEMLA